MILSPKDALWRAEGAILLEGQTSTPSLPEDEQAEGWKVTNIKLPNFKGKMATAKRSAAVLHHNPHHQPVT